MDCWLVRAARFPSPVQGKPGTDGHTAGTFYPRPHAEIPQDRRAAAGAFLSLRSDDRTQAEMRACGGVLFSSSCRKFGHRRVT